MNLRYQDTLTPLYFRLLPLPALLAHHYVARPFRDPRDFSRYCARSILNLLTLSLFFTAPSPRYLFTIPLASRSDDLPIRLPLRIPVPVRIDRAATPHVSDLSRIAFA